MSEDRKFPRLVYRSAEEHILVDSQEAYDEALANKWFDSVPEALAVRAGAAAPASLVPRVPGSSAGGAGGGNKVEPSREELEALARQLNISFQPNIGTAKLKRRIDLALEKS